MLGRNGLRRRPRGSPAAVGVGPAGFEQPGAVGVEVPGKLGRPLALDEVELALGGLRSGLGPAARGGGIRSGVGPVVGVRAAAL